jgi:glycosyltransferase involved in cell wall biosynthesis
MRILVATDAWRPQVNGVVRTYERLSEALEPMGVALDFVTPLEFRTLPCPTYPEIRLSLVGPGQMARRIEQSAPDFIHIATEGPIGIMVRSYCRKRHKPFTTSYHTRFPEYMAARFPVRESWIYALQRRFHNAGNGIMVATPTLRHELEQRGFAPLLSWSRGVDTKLFRPRRERQRNSAEPVFLFVGRIAVEKNIEAFLKLDLPGRKVVVGDGPLLDALRSRYPQVEFPGARQGEELAGYYAEADVFVFPSLTDTYGIVLLEALASGLPVAAYPVMGPVDVIGDEKVGVLDIDLRAAALAALEIDPQACRAYALKFSWEACARQFLDNVTKAGAPQLRAA